MTHQFDQKVFCLLVHQEFYNEENSDESLHVIAYAIYLKKKDKAVDSVGHVQKLFSEREKKRNYLSELNFDESVVLSSNCRFYA